MHPSRFHFSILFTAAAACAAGPANVPNAVAVFDAYLAQAARTVPEYRTELRAGEPLQSEAPGRILARGPIIGAFTFRAKTYGELTRAERAEMLRDPRFRAFVAALRTQVDRAPVGIAAQPAALLLPSPDARPTLERFDISPEDMLQRRPIFIVLASP